MGNYVKGHGGGGFCENPVFVRCGVLWQQVFWVLGLGLWKCSFVFWRMCRLRGIKFLWAWVFEGPGSMGVLIICEVYVEKYVEGCGGRILWGIWCLRCGDLWQQVFWVFWVRMVEVFSFFGETVV